MNAVFIYGKQYKRELLLPHKEIVRLQNFLKSTTGNDVLILNTNLGVEIYYECIIDCSEMIVSSFLLHISKINKNRNNFRIVTIKSDKEILNRAQLIFSKLVMMPIIFRSYTKSTCCQLNMSYETNKLLTNKLFVLWQQVLQQQLTRKLHYGKTKEFLDNLHDLYLENSCKTAIKSLVIKAMSSVRYN